jgi:hypothetical protein
LFKSNIKDGNCKYKYQLEVKAITCGSNGFADLFAVLPSNSNSTFTRVKSYPDMP